MMQTQAPDQPTQKPHYQIKPHKKKHNNNFQHHSSKTPTPFVRTK
ncbi:MAG: hypothetical protein AAF380_00040 [Bacteroidota bacterium]